ncbi:hypothetical protein PG997_008615 [Apiospora hydei]|uniref:Uncharacterized protein n=1 Tax=Apiospora hydei TaxID=1337664 RepID=A0ABR1WCR8_9PEZI
MNHLRSVRHHRYRHTTLAGDVDDGGARLEHGELVTGSDVHVALDRGRQSGRGEEEGEEGLGELHGAGVDGLQSFRAYGFVDPWICVGEIVAEPGSE